MSEAATRVVVAGETWHLEPGRYDFDGEAFAVAVERPSVTCCARDRDGKLLDSVVLLGDKEAVDAVTGLKADREALLAVADAAAALMALDDIDLETVSLEEARTANEAVAALREALQRLGR